MTIKVIFHIILNFRLQEIHIKIVNYKYTIKTSLIICIILCTKINLI